MRMHLGGIVAIAWNTDTYENPCLQLLSNSSNFNQFDLVTFDLSQFMKLDSAAVLALNLFPSPADAGNKLRCLMGVLNYCKTAPGQRLLAQWLKQPLMDIAKIGNN